LIHFHDFDMPAKPRALFRQVGVDVEHTAIVVTHHAKTVVLHYARHLRRFDPFIHLAPTLRVLAEHPCDLMERYTGSIKNIGDLRHRASRTKGKPLARHGRTVSHPIKTLVVNSRLGLKIQNDDRHLGPPYDGQYRRGKRISRDVQKY